MKTAGGVDESTAQNATASRAMRGKESEATDNHNFCYSMPDCAPAQGQPDVSMLVRSPPVDAGPQIFHQRMRSEKAHAGEKTGHEIERCPALR